MIRTTAPLSLALLLTALLSTLLISPAPARAEEPSASLTINRLVICSGIENREPVDTVSAFPAGSEMAYAFLEATSISSDVEVSFVWFHDGSEVARVLLPIRAGNRWRTNSSKQLAGRTGAWRIEVQDGSSAVLAGLDFTVE